MCGMPKHVFLMVAMYCAFINFSILGNLCIEYIGYFP